MNRNGGTISCAPPSAGASRSPARRVSSESPPCKTEGQISIKEACLEVLADIERAEEARRAYAMADAAQWADYKD